MINRKHKHFSKTFALLWIESESVLLKNFHFHVQPKAANMKPTLPTLIRTSLSPSLGLIESCVWKYEHGGKPKVKNFLRFMFLEFWYLNISSQFKVQGDLELSDYLINDNFPLGISHSHAEACGALTPIDKLSLSSEAVLVCPGPWKFFMPPLKIELNLNPFVQVGPNPSQGNEDLNQDESHRLTLSTPIHHPPCEYLTPGSEIISIRWTLLLWFTAPGLNWKSAISSVVAASIEVCKM